MLYCNNKTCPNVLVVSAVTEGTDNLILETRNTLTPVNNGRYILKLPISLLPVEATTTVEQVFVELGDGTEIPLQCLLGNNVFSDQIKSMNRDCCGNIILRLAYGSTPAHFKIISQQLTCSVAYGTSTTGTETTNG